MGWSRVIISVVLFLLLAQVASAQGSVAISRWNIGAGGGQVSGESIAVSGESIALLVSLGQAIAGPTSGGVVSVGGGFQGGGGSPDTRAVTYLPLVMKSAR